MVRAAGISLTRQESEDRTMAAGQDQIRSTRVARLKKVDLAAEDENAAGRRGQIMAVAARLFATRGFHATTIRDIAADAGILPGSTYYYFASKEEIFLAVHEAGMESIANAVQAAIATISSPWERLEAVAVAHAEALLASHDLPVVVSPHFTASLTGLRETIVTQRDRYDRLISDVIAELNLPAHIDPRIFRMHFLGALNWLPVWYKSGGRYTPAEIARQLILMLKPLAGFSN